MLPDSEFTILNAIYLKKMAAAVAVAAATSLPEDAVTRTLASAADAGWLMDLPGGAMLLPEGTEQVLDYYRNTYAAVRADPTVVHWYDGFETLNTRFIAAVSEWQRSEGDERAERRVLQAAGRLAKDIAQLVPLIPRYGAYRQRLERSIDLVDAGSQDFVCKPTVDSVHNIWFEFHEDILAVLGRPRDTT